MSDFSLTLVLQIKTSKIINGMAKVQIKSERITPFGGIFHVRELYSRYVGPVIDKVLEKRITTLCRKGVYSSLYSKQKMRIYAKKVNRFFCCFNHSSHFCKQKLRIYAEKVNGDGNKARCSSEEAH